MKRLVIISLSVLTAVMAAKAAFAFNTDDKSMNSPASAENFSDPDDKMPGMMHMNMSGSGSKNTDSTDPSTVHYEYDPQSGTYVPGTSKQ